MAINISREHFRGQRKIDGPGDDELAALLQNLQDQFLEEGQLETFPPLIPRQNVPMVGVINGVNTVFVLPFGDKAAIVPPATTIAVRVNGVEYSSGVENDYVLSESGGAGSGFDTITMLHFAPKEGDSITATYFINP